MTINGGALLDFVAWFFGGWAALTLVCMCVGIWADRTFDEFGRRRDDH